MSTTHTITPPTDTDSTSQRDQAAALPAERLEAIIVDHGRTLAQRTYALLVHVGELDARGTWARWGAWSCASWLAQATDLDLATARTYVRVARALRDHPTLDHALASGAISYAKARCLVAHLTDANADELVDLAQRTPTRDLPAAIAAWSRRNEDPDAIDRRHHRDRAVTWHTTSDGMVHLTAHLEPHRAGAIIAAIDQRVMSERAPAGACLSQQRADALHHLATDGGASVTTELVIHVTADGCRLTDGTPLGDHPVAGLLPNAYVSLLLHDNQRQPIDASPRRRSPTRRQRRVLDARQPTCAEPGCDARTLLHYDHIHPYTADGPTTLDNLQRLCGPHNRAKGAGSPRSEQ
jgi:hypothetical protein